MRRFFISFIVIVLPLIICCQGKIDIEKEKAAIIAVNEKESLISQAMGYESFESAFAERPSCYVQDESTVMLGGGRNGFYYIHGWSKLDSAINSWVENAKANNIQPSTNKYEFKNYEINVFPESAWAIYDLYNYNQQGELVGDVKCVKFFEKVDGEWKIAYNGWVNLPSYEVVDEEAEETE